MDDETKADLLTIASGILGGLTFILVMVGMLVAASQGDTAWTVCFAAFFIARALEPKRPKR